MANLEITKKEEPVTVYKEVDKYNLQLDLDEFTAVMVLVGGLSGNSKHPLRVLVNNMWKDIFEDIYIKEVIDTPFSEFSEKYSELRKGLASNVD